MICYHVVLARNLLKLLLEFSCNKLIAIDLQSGQHRRFDAMIHEGVKVGNPNATPALQNMRSGDLEAGTVHAAPVSLAISEMPSWVPRPAHGQVPCDSTQRVPGSEVLEHLAEILAQSLHFTSS